MKMMQVFRGGVIAFFIISLSSVQAQDSAIGELLLNIIHRSLALKLS